jgi:mRNA-degrading endonuclease RelE of RelBE toxin-antitoxin system
MTSLIDCPVAFKLALLESLQFYSAQPDPFQFSEPLTGSSEYRFRIGDYRVMFEVMHNTMWVLAIKCRDEAYR